jgi:AhpD family alkylhydroperoxidase
LLILIIDQYIILKKVLPCVQVEQSLLELIYFRVSQVNGYAYCLDMHSKDLRAKGETEQRLYALNTWREAYGYSQVYR